MKSTRWFEITPSEYAWEREALDYIKSRLPDGEPFRAWSNFEFIADDGSVNEVDLLVVSIHKVYLVEIKSWSGVITGDPSTWRRKVDGNEFLVDNPLLLANRKAKKLISLLKTQKALAKQRRPFVEAAVFLSRSGVRCRLEGRARTGVYLSSESERDSHPNILDVLLGTAGFDPRRPPPRIDRLLSRAFARAMKQAGIRPSQRQRRVADYMLQKLLLETDSYQDWEAEHASVSGSKRRVRIYPLSRASSEAVRAERRRTAEREYQLLDNVAHDGILRVEQFTNAEQGPALVFEHDPDAERLDRFLERGSADGLDLATRLELLRQLAEALKYAHERRVYHRGLHPQKVLVTAPDTDRPKLKIFDWGTGEDGSLRGSGTPVTPSTGAPAAPGLTGDDKADVYLAPETIQGGYVPEKLDIFSLGAIGYRLFSGQPPASTVAALNARLSSAGGLRLSDALDGLPDSLQSVVESATEPEVGNRPDSISAFLDLLVSAEQELAEMREAPEPGVHPLDANPDDMLEHDFLVERRLGKGSTAVALKVEHDDGGGVLKVALDPSLNDRIRREGEVLRSLRHPNIVAFHRHVELSGHAALFIAMAGTENKTGTYTLADRLREEGRLSLDLLQRFGDQLLDVVQWLEDKGISHRDLKPDNIGVSTSGADKSLILVVFDFSLADTPAENIRAGTPQYLDPFLQQRRPPRWDVYAERFAAAMTLHEMATGVLPRWGDGAADPMRIDEEVTVDAEWFDPSVRAPLAAFFAKALARDYRTRFDSAEEMRHAWRACFEAIDVQSAGDEEGRDLPNVLDDVTRETPLRTLGLSPRLLNALDRLGAHTVAQLVDLPRIRLYRNKGIGQRIVRLMRELSERLAEHLAERGHTLDTATTVDGDDHSIDPAVWSIDLLASRLVSTQVPENEARLVRTVLGMDGGLGPLPARRDIAALCGATPTEIDDAIDRARKRWSRHRWMTPLRDTTARIVTKYGGIMTLPELAEALAATRGSTETGDARRRRAGTVAAAALEMESVRDDARYHLHRLEASDGAYAVVLATEVLDPALTARATARAGWVRELGRLADEIADADPLPPPVRVTEALEEATPPAGMQPLAPDRILHLAVQFAERAAISSRGELYPRGMTAERAAKLGASSLLGPTRLSEEDIRKRIASRYPDAEVLPERPMLDDLLEAAGLTLEWDATVRKYHSRVVRSSYASSTPTVRSSGGDDDVADHADALDERLDRVVKTQGFLALSVAPRYLSGVERYLATTLELTFFSLEAGLIRHMHTVAEELGADWKVVVAADAAPSGGADRRRLDQLVRRASPGLGREIANRREPLLLTRPGLLARYRQLGVLAEIQEACQRGEAPAARLLCITADESINMPVIDDCALPVMFASAWMRPGRAWLARAGECRRGDGAAAGVDGPGAGQAVRRSAAGAHLICATISP